MAYRVAKHPGLGRHEGSVTPAGDTAAHDRACRLPPEAAGLNRIGAARRQRYKLREARRTEGRDMFQLLRSISSLDLAARQAPIFGLSFLVSSLFYRFGSFALEAVAFLATWFVLDAMVEAVRAVVRRVRSGTRPADPAAT
jgi:hypothetical protein